MSAGPPTRVNYGKALDPFLTSLAGANDPILGRLLQADAERTEVEQEKLEEHLAVVRIKEPIGPDSQQTAIARAEWRVRRVLVGG
jgi:hypothetical protein